MKIDKKRLQFNIVVNGKWKLVNILEMANCTANRCNNFWWRIYFVLLTLQHSRSYAAMRFSSANTSFSTKLFTGVPGDNQFFLEFRNLKLEEKNKILCQIHDGTF